MAAAFIKIAVDNPYEEIGGCYATKNPYTNSAALMHFARCCGV